jgi:hypothetical protein
MFGLITMLLTTLGATGMGSMLKIVGGLVQSISDEREAKAKREMARDLAMSNSDIKFQQAVFGNASDPEANLFTRATRRLIALIGMLNRHFGSYHRVLFHTRRKKVNNYGFCRYTRQSKLGI